MADNVSHKEWLEQFLTSAKVKALSEYSWEVTFNSPQQDMEDSILVKILKLAKKKISLLSHVDAGLLAYQKLLSKKIDADTLQVSIFIDREKPPMGESILRYLKAISSSGKEYEDMVLELDLYPLKLSGEQMTLKDVKKLLQKEGFSLDKVNMDAIEKAIIKLQKYSRPVKDVVILEGIFPEPSEDAELEYFCALKKLAKGGFVGVEKVIKEKMICRKKPAKKGVLKGVSVWGIPIPPEVPKEIEIKGELGINVSEDGNEVFTSRTGILHIRDEKSTGHYVKSKLIFSIEPIEVISGSQPLNITMDKPVEIKGGLKTGSQVISRYQVIVSGDIEEDVSIQTSGSIDITGNIIGGNLASEEDIDGSGNVTGTRLIAEGKLTIKGTVKNSNLIADEVCVSEIVGGTIIAGKKIEVNTISPDDEGYTPTIKVGSSYHKKEVVQENNRFIDFAKDNLDKINRIYGKEVISSVGSANISQMIMLFMKSQRKAGISKMSDSQINAMKKLLESVIPIRVSMHEKIDSNRKLRSKKSKNDLTSPVIIVKSSVKSNVSIEIDGIKGELTPSDGAVTMEVSKELIKKTAAPTG
ncbi:MAG: DUF342 domain-containing protein [candidate division Zixibacteria bacterium]|nr:DUF342 domain-containing protein [Candidatus Tariuqbacter arcticus]